MFTKNRLFTVLIITGLFFALLAQPVQVAQAQAPRSPQSANQAPQGDKSSGVITPQRVNDGYGCPVQTDIPLLECQALEALYDQTNGVFWTNNTGWEADNYPCTWFGVTCFVGHVTTIDLQNNNLTGTIPTELGNLPELRNLLLDQNHLSGSIPAELGNLTHLQILYLNNNNLTGGIPSALGNLASLQQLILNTNPLGGSIPVNLDHLSNLASLDFGHCQLTGSIPPELGELTNLQFLGLYSNHLSGGIPTGLDTLTNLINLGLSQNQLSGSIPAELSNLVNLQHMYLGNNQLSGLIPDALDSLPSLTNMNLDYNMLSATDPGLITFVTNLDPTWALTQTVPPSGLHVLQALPDSIVLTWTPILYTGDGGYYEISMADTLGGTYTVVGDTVNKLSSQYTVPGLYAGKTYYFKLRTYTPSHGDQQNELWSDYTDPLSATTGGGVINPKLTLVAVQTNYYPSLVDAAYPAGIYLILATFQNISPDTLDDIYFQVAELTNNNLVLCDSGFEGVGCAITQPGNTVAPGAQFQVAFIIGLQVRANFRFYVDAYGVASIEIVGLSSTPLSDSFRFVIHDFGYSFFMPTVQR